MQRSLAPFIALLIAFFTSASAMAADESAKMSIGDLSISNGWVRATIGPSTVSAGYLVLENAGADDDRLISVATEAATASEIHTHKMVDGVMKMGRIEAIALPAGGSQELKPGGEHIMLIGLTKPLAAGDEVTLDLTFENAGSVSVVLPVISAKPKGE